MVYDCYRARLCHHAALSQAKKIRRSRSRPYSEHANLAGRGLWWPLISPQAGRPELATETPEKGQPKGKHGGSTSGRDSGVPMRDMSMLWGRQVHHYQGRRRLRSFWGAARISGLSPDSPPLFRRAKTPWSIRIHIEFDPFIHLPFSCCLGALCVCALQDNSPPASPVFPPCDDHFTASSSPDHDYSFPVSRVTALVQHPTNSTVTLCLSVSQSVWQPAWSPHPDGSVLRCVVTV